MIINKRYGLRGHQPASGLVCRSVGWFGWLAMAAGLSGAVAEDSALTELPAYHKATGEVAGSLKCVGSDTMNNLVALWAEGFKKYYPSVR
ncbi:MAG: Phosphate-binding protein PstS precursor, partial [Planctomycetota bacterium]